MTLPPPQHTLVILCWRDPRSGATGRGQPIPCHVAEGFIAHFAGDGLVYWLETRAEWAARYRSSFTEHPTKEPSDDDR